ncbi:MAG: hypothetical protein A3E87_08910 [Gammaproteobacteria bacterium RIFCSPHIGHO2_12_FULL_35_23]|nr:MAG: hypothetical protein A3E87_08910 [Gammaproteobacteria bacterium RIFCSPHIGHO2_12_FULL_35_23]
MVKNIIFLIVASVLVILLANYLNEGLQQIMSFHDLLTGWLSQIFSKSKTGVLLVHLLALFIIPLVIAGIVAGIYWIFKRKSFPIFHEVMWVLWIILATLLVVSR